MNRTFIIAEAGVNFNSDMKIAKKLIEAAAMAGADAVKFQTFKAKNLVTRDAKKAEYQLETTKQEESQYDMLKCMELTYEMHLELLEYCRRKEIKFLSAPFDVESVHLLNSLNISMVKIPSGEINNLPFLREVAKCKLPVILSTGMSNMTEIKAAIKILTEYGNADISILHCNTQYPTPMEDVNLNVLKTLKRELKVKVGYSDHTEGIEVAIAAVALGAEIIEKHITLDRNMEGPDHKASVEPHELAAMVAAIRNIESALGSEVKVPSASELANINIVRKSIVAKKYINKGEVFDEKNITTKRPGNGVSPMEWENVIGKIADKNYEEDELIKI